MQPITEYTKSGECPAMRVYIKISNSKQECFWGKQSASNSVIATNEGCTASFTRDAWLRKKKAIPHKVEPPLVSLSCEQYSIFGKRCQEFQKNRLYEKKYNISEKLLENRKDIIDTKKAVT